MPASTVRHRGNDRSAQTTGCPAARRGATTKIRPLARGSPRDGRPQLRGHRVRAAALRDQGPGAPAERVPAVRRLAVPRLQGVAGEAAAPHRRGGAVRGRDAAPRDAGRGAPAAGPLRPLGEQLRPLQQPLPAAAPRVLPAAAHRRRGDAPEARRAPRRRDGRSDGPSRGARRRAPRASSDGRAPRAQARSRASSSASRPTASGPRTPGP